MAEHSTDQEQAVQTFARCPEPTCTVAEGREHFPGCPFDADGCTACLYEFRVLPWLCPHGPPARTAA